MQKGTRTACAFSSSSKLSRMFALLELTKRKFLSSFLREHCGKEDVHSLCLLQHYVNGLDYRTVVLLSPRSAAISARFLTGCFQIDLNVAPNQFGSLLIKYLFYRSEQTDRQTHRQTDTHRLTENHFVQPHLILQSCALALALALSNCCKLRLYLSIITCRE